MTSDQLKLLEELLAEAPSTVAECAALLDAPRRQVQIGIWQLTRSKRAQVVGHAAHPDFGEIQGCRRHLKLYSASSLSTSTGARDDR